MTADAAARAIREADAQGSIGIISSDPHPPYNRPPLSKGLWKGDDPAKTVWRGTETIGVDLRLGRRVTAMNTKQHAVTDDRGNNISYEKLLLATGGTPRRLALQTGQIIYYRTFDDYLRLRALANETLRFAVLGGGFIGSEIGAALKLVGRDVTMIVPEEGIGARVFPADLSKFPVDVIVAGLGIVPNVELAEQAGLHVENGIVVDELLRTSAPDVYAAGDVANFFNPALGTRIRVEHEDNANTMGAAGGRSMAGKGTPYTHLPFFYSDLFALGYEAVGELDPRLQTDSVWKERFREGVIYYLKDDKVRGVLLWNTWGQVDSARAIIGTTGRLE